MTKEQVEALIRYIDAVIDEKLDNGSSADERLFSYSAKLKAEAELRALLITESEE